jgi:hypothetical protein
MDRFDRLHNEAVEQTCDMIERERVERDSERAELARVAARPHRVVHEIPRRDSVNGYVYDV